jgi:hypothetical protein
MKKLITIAFAILSIGFISTGEANAAAVAAAGAAAPQIRVQIGPQRRGNRRYNRRARTYTQSRYVRQGRRTFRETYQITAWPNGRTSSTLISRVRVS